uniref:Peptidase M14 domain-containing protein n=1 Tax=Globisporangium ultimum (strain ATCC 200006 / CBS 805.95 / DAOM BR144) TaxID=431595 RepID=K3WKC5_GLOUD
MNHNENFQTQRHGFGIDTRLIYKRCKGKDAVVPPGGIGPLDTLEDLRFNALFESGNLDRAYRVLGRHYASSNELLGAASHGTSSPHSQPPFAFFVKVDMEYDLYCDTDLNTHGHIQWYFFRVTLPAALKQTYPKLKVRFNIRNMLKRSSLYNEGMLPTVYVEAPKANQRGWHHAGGNVCYYKNADTYRNHKSGKVQNYYTLSFVYEFALCSDTSGSAIGDDTVVYFAHCYPYTYTKLQRFLLSLQKDPDRNRFFKRRIICKTIAGNSCDLLTITDFTQEDSQDQPHHMKRTGIFLSARVHPGESNSSFIMHGIIDFLTGSSLEAQYLRHNFVFKIVPMLNPDGVVHGNYRCSLAGTDLNRRWMQPSPDLHPTIFATKLAILSMAKTRLISLYCDIHGHSRKKNMFLYGCRPFESNYRKEAARLRLFPHVLGKTSSSQRGGFYSFSDCTFSVSGSKKGTGRVVVWKEAQVLHSFTLEASFYGAGTNKKQHTDSLAMPASALSCKHFTPNQILPCYAAIFPDGQHGASASHSAHS